MRNYPFFLRQVIAPEEIVDPNVDEHSVMTYLSQFPKAKLKPGTPVRSKQLNPKKAIAYGPGTCGVLRVLPEGGIWTGRGPLSDLGSASVRRH